MSRQLLYSLLLLAGGTLLAAFLMWLRPEPVEVERIEPVPLVEVVPLFEASGPIPVLGSGTVEARDEVAVTAEVSGRLTYVNPNFREGGSIAKGAALLRIDQSDYLNQVRAAEADVAAQSVAVLEAEQEVEIAREELSRFAARAKAAETSGAVESQILPPRAMSKAMQRIDIAGPSADGKATSKSLATREPQLASAKAQRDRAAANLSDAKLRLGRTRVRAPFSGIVRSENAAIGQLVQPGEVLGALVSTDDYEVRVSLTPDEAALIPGLLDRASGRIPASVTYAYGSKIYRMPAYVERANAILDEATRNIQVFVRVPAPLRGGREVDTSGAEVPSSGKAPPLLLTSFVNVAITGASLDSYAAVPADAVRPGNEIWVVREGKLHIIKVRVIQRSDETAYIVSPELAGGGALVTSNITAPIEGMELRIAGAQAQSQEAEGATEE